MKRRWIGWAVALVAVAVGVALSSRWRSPAPPALDANPRPNIVLITIDTMRADRLGRGLTPNLDQLAAAGMRFTNARAAVPLTLPSHVTIMTGTLPPVHGVHDNGVAFKPGPKTLARALKDAGYRTGAFVGAYVLNHVFGLADGFETYDDRVHRNPAAGAQLEAERRGGEVVDAALAWLAVQDEDRPFFLWVHLYDPHVPYNPPPEFLARTGGNAYDGEIAYADAQVGRLLDTLESRGFLNGGRGTFVAVAGDHGEGLGDHGEQLHGMLAYDSTLRVPLILRGRGVMRGADDTNVSLAALAGGLITLAGVAVPAGMSEGLHLSQAAPAEVYSETEYPRAAGWHALTALTADRWKLILSSEAELYDVAADPAEQHNLAAEKASVVEGMSKRLRELSVSKSAHSSSSVSPEAAERLRALGYVGSGTPSAGDDSDAPNPARHIDAWTRFERALGQVNDGRAAEALSALKQLEARYPDSWVFASTYARALKDSGRARDAVEIYKRAIARWPNEAALYHDLSVAARAAGDVQEALRAEQAALAIEGTNPAALNGLGLLQAEAGKMAEAAASFERATAADPSNASFWTNLGNARRDLGSLDGAEQAYRKALDIDANYADAENGLGVILVQRKQPHAAIAFLERALRHDPTLYEARLNLGIAYQESGDLRRAAETYRSLLETAPATATREREAAKTLLEGIR